MGTQVVQRRGIYHGLPVYPDNVKGLTAIITGANGISGQHMLRVLAEAPERWSKIYCLSRRPPAIPGGLPKHAEHIPLDFLKKPEEIAKVLKDHKVTADYVFFYSYIQAEPKEGAGLWSDAEEMTRVNKLLLDNLLAGLDAASIKPKRFMLQTGAKQYGIHLGPTDTPQIEDHPRVELEPNFYYPQEDSLFAWSKKSSVGWTVVRPSFILGAVPDAAMNLMYAIGIYAAVCKKQNKPLDWPGSLEAYEVPQCQSSAMLNGYLEEWSVLSENTNNQQFNVCDDSAFTWSKLWPKLASWYGIEHNKPDVNAKLTDIEIGYNPPPRGYGPPAKLRCKFTLTEWGKQKDVQQAWSELAKEHGLQDKEIPDPDRVLAFGDGGLLGAVSVNFSMDKAKKFGWHGFVDSAECMLECLVDFARLKILPPIPNPVYK